jgi:lipoprotein-releasing system ATP-binding protein
LKSPSYELPSDGLQVVDLRKAFLSPAGDRIEVLRGLSLSAEVGQSVAIIGASGSGKSTLLHLLGGLDQPDHGSISLHNQEVTKLTPAASARFRQSLVSFVFQFHYLIGDLTAVENVAMPLLVRRRTQVEALEGSKSLLQSLGLEDRIDYPVTHLSGGEQQRVAVARALITNPSLILADEPTGNLDTSIAEEVAKTLTNYTARHPAIAIIATHNPDLARMCNRILKLEDGRLQKFS